MSTPRLSVIMPAHDEAAVIAGTLTRILDGDPDGEIEIIVAANGCTDGTAAIAGALSPRIHVIEVDEASKIAGLNAGDDAASVHPRVYVDADVSVSAATLLALAEALDDPVGSAAASAPLVASPTFTVDTSASNWFVRAHYAIWELSEYRTRGHIGSGVYALSEAGRARFGEFPEVIADDRFVQQLFTEAERLTLADHSFVVRAPRTLRAQIRRATRIDVGNRQLPASLQNAPTDAAVSRHGTLLARVAARPGLWPAFVVYCYGYAVPQLLARRQLRRGEVTTWNRDETSRV